MWFLFCLFGVATAKTITSCDVTQSNNVWSESEPGGEIIYDCNIKAATTTAQALTIMVDAAKVIFRGPVGSSSNPLSNFQVKPALGSTVLIEIEDSVVTSGNQAYRGAVTFTGAGNQTIFGEGTSVVEFFEPVSKTTGDLAVMALSLVTKSHISAGGELYVATTNPESGSISLGGDVTSSGGLLSVMGNCLLTKAGTQKMEATGGVIMASRISKQSSLTGIVTLEAGTSAGAITLDALDIKAGVNVVSPLTISGNIQAQGPVSTKAIILNGENHVIEGSSVTIAASGAALSKTTTGNIDIKGTLIIQGSVSQLGGGTTIYAPCTFEHFTSTGLLNVREEANINGDISVQGLTLGDAVWFGKPGGASITQTVDAGSQTFQCTGTVTRLSGAVLIRGQSVILRDDVDVGGELSIVGQLEASGDITAVGIELTQNGALSSSLKQTIDAGTGTLTINTQLSKSAGALDLLANDIVLEGMVAAEGGAIVITATALTINGDLRAAAGLTLPNCDVVLDGPVAQAIGGGGAFLLKKKMTKLRAGDVTLSGSQLTFEGNVNIADGLSVQGSLDAQSVIAGEQLSMQDATLHIHAEGKGINIAGDLTIIAAASFELDAGLGGLTCTGEISKATGDLVLFGTTAVSLHTVTVTQGALTISCSDTLINIGGDLTAATYISLTNTQLDGTAGVEQTIEASSIFVEDVSKNNNGAVTFKYHAALQAGSITSNGDISLITTGISPVTTLSGDVTSSGDFAADSDLDMDGTIQSILVTGQVTAQAIAKMTAGDLTIRGSKMIFGAGTVKVDNGGLFLQGPVQAASSNISSSMNLNIAGLLTLTDSGLQWVKGAQSVFLNAAVFKAAGDLHIEGGQVTMSGDLDVQDGHCDILGRVAGVAFTADQALAKVLTIESTQLTLGGSGRQTLISSDGRLVIKSAIAKASGVLSLEAADGVVCKGSVLEVAALYSDSQFEYEGATLLATVGDLDFRQALTLTGSSDTRIDSDLGWVRVTDVTKTQGGLQLAGNLGIRIEGNVMVLQGPLYVEDELFLTGNMTTAGTGSLMTFNKDILLTARNDQKLVSGAKLQAHQNLTKIEGGLQIGQNGAGSSTELAGDLVVWDGALRVHGAISSNSDIYAEMGITLDTVEMTAPVAQTVDAMDGCLVITNSITKPAADLYLGGRECITLATCEVQNGWLYLHDAYTSTPAPQADKGVGTLKPRPPGPMRPVEPTPAPTSAPTVHPTPMPTQLTLPPSPGSTPYPTNVPPTPYPTDLTRRPTGPTTPPSAVPTEAAPTSAQSPSPAAAAKAKGADAGAIVGILLAVLVVIAGVVLAVCFLKNRRSRVHPKEHGHELLSNDLGSYQPPPHEV